jgi:ferredoxin
MTRPLSKSFSTVTRQDFPHLLEALTRRGYQLAGPTIRRGDLVYDRLSGIEDLPVGWRDWQAPASFRLRPREDQALFGYGVGQHSWKHFLFPARQLLWQTHRAGGGFDFMPQEESSPRYAFLGVHPCDLAAIRVLDKVFLAGAYRDPIYERRRQSSFILALNCGHACGTGFCASMGTGPRAGQGFDLALTEIVSPSGPHYFVAEAGSDAGHEILGEIPHQPASPEELAAAENRLKQAETEMGRVVQTQGLKELLYRNYEHPRWDDVAGRCLTCGNCTWVCPTCFCHTVEDLTDLTGETAQRWRRMDVCFSVNFSYLHGGSVRVSPRSRYRQWMTHKLATWVDQFGCFGCIGCGRCITWCPVGIDITEEVRAIRESENP